MANHPVLIAGEWRKAQSRRSFSSENPALGEKLPGEYPISDWADCDAALAAATAAAAVLRTSPPDAIAAFLDAYAGRIEARKAEHRRRGPRRDRPAEGAAARGRRAAAHHGTAAAGRGGRPRGLVGAADDRHEAQHPLACSPPSGPSGSSGRTTSRSRSTASRAAISRPRIAAGNPVIAKANSSHPGTTRLLAEEAHAAATEAGLPPGTVQLLYRTSHEDGERLVSDPRTGATGYTGSRSAGLKLKAAADAAGKPIYLELSSVNPLLILPGALAERGDSTRGRVRRQLPDGDGPVLHEPEPRPARRRRGDASSSSPASGRGSTRAAPTPLLSSGVLRSLGESVVNAAGGRRQPGHGRSARGAGLPLLQHAAARLGRGSFWPRPRSCRRRPSATPRSSSSREMRSQLAALVETLEGNLTGCFYTDTRGCGRRALRRSSRRCCARASAGS